MCEGRIGGILAAVKRFVSGAFVTLALSLTADAVDFEKDVYPILKSNCIDCHRDGKEKGDLNLETHKLPDSIGSGRIINPGKPSSGLFMKVILSDDPDNRMPPKGGPLSDKEIETLKIWISQGAELGEAQEADPDAPEPLAGVWTNAEGKEIEATLVKVADGKAHLKMKSGKIFPYAIEKLSKESQAKVKEWAAKAK